MFHGQPSQPSRAIPPKRGTMTSLLKSFWADDSGQTLAEYALLLALVVIVVIATLRLLGPTIRDFYTNVNTMFKEL